LFSRRIRQDTPLGAAALALVLVSSTDAPGTVTLNEVLYDPDGADGGHEFVELHNGGPTPVCLSGIRLQFANGAVGDVWHGRWTGGPADTLASGGLFLVVDQGWQGPAPDAVASLGLQNGPDAVRLERDGEVLDLLGYGDLAHAALYEGQPHAGAGGGASLARRPDGHDTDRNHLDWTVLARPTPGEPNYPTYGLEIASSRAEPPSLTGPGRDVALDLDIVVSGLSALPAAEVRLVDGDGSVLDAVWSAGVVSGAAGRLVFHWQPSRAGTADLHLHWSLPESAGACLVAPVGRYVADLPPLVLAEVMAAPSNDACEWVEVAVAGAASVDLGDYALADADGGTCALPSRLLSPGERCVLVQSFETYDRWWGVILGGADAWPCPVVSPEHHALEPAGSWPTLNNSAPADREYADRIHLLDDAGTVLDHATVGWAGAAVPSGRSLERSGLAPTGHDLRLWRASTATTGSTPGCENALEAEVPAAGSLVVTGGTGDDGLLFTFALGDPERAWRLEIFDLTGRRVRSLGGDALGAGPRRITWDGADDRGRSLSREAVIALLTVTGADGARIRRIKTLAVVGGGR